MEKSIVKHRAAAAIKDSSPSRSHNATRSKAQKDSIKDLKHAAVACVICADDNIRFAAIGSCDHPICSLCSMRIRVKTLEKGCPLCKQLMETVIVFSVKVNGLLPYSSFGVWGLDSPATGLEIDHRAGMIFADCKDHFKEMDKIRSLVCPLKKCNLRFSSDEALLKHMCAAHAGQNLCVLCLKNRPLFISEHKVMTNADLKKHMCAPPGALTGAGGDKTAGHPLCLFCNEHFFDSHALYLHMKREHQSCHLCPTSYQFRFYPSIDELRVHLHTEHFVCNICEKASLNGVEGPGVFGSSFRHHGEYSSHLLSMHGIKNHSMTLGFQIGYEGDGRIRERESGRGKGRKASNQLSFLDLDMTSADPNRTSSSQASNRQQGQSNGGGRGHVRDANSEAVSVNESMNDAATSESRRRQLFHLQTSAAIAAAPLVPPHMRVAGRVVAGRFQRDADDDNLQAAADEQALIAAAGGSRAPFSGGPDGGWSGRAINSMNMNRAFPALSAASSSTKEGEMEEKRDTSGRHPMSLVSVIQRDAAAKRAIEEEKRVKMAEVENRRLRRNEMMADGLGLNNVPASATDASATLDPSELRRPLFPPTLLTWAKNNKVELQKLEKKMVDLINDKGSNSSQLKAMGPSSRNAVHGLSKYYFLNSYEYDPEPRRYISLVKSARSSMPSVLLSAASSMPPLAPANILSAMNLPILYVSLANPSNGFAPTDTVSEGRSRKKAGEDTLTLNMDGNITVGDVVSRVKAVLKSLIVQHHPYSLPNSHRILLVKAGATSVALSFSDTSVAVRVFDMIAAYKKFGDSGASDIPPGLLDTFYVEPAFAPEIYREVVEEPSDERKSAGLYSSEAFTDPDGFTGSYSKSMPVSGKADKNPAISGGRPGNAFAFDPSIATDWALLMEDEDSDAEEGKSTEYDANSVLSEGKASTLTADKEDVAPSILNKLAPPPGLLNYSAFPPPPGFPMHNESVSTTVSSENKYEKEAGRSAVEDEVRLPELESVSCSPRPVYRHLVLQPRSIPIASIKVTEEPRTST